MINEHSFPIVTDGFWFGEEENQSRYIFDDNDLKLVTENQPGFSKALRMLKLNSLNWVSLPYSERSVLVSEKKRTYTKSPLDLMFLVLNEDENDLQPKSVDQAEINSSDLGNTLIYVHKVLNTLVNVAEKFGKKVVKKTIAINFHQDPLPEENIDGNRKTYAQTIPSLHLHAFVLTEDDIKPSIDQSLEKKERDIVKDPMSFVVRAVNVIPSIQQQFLLSGIDQVKTTKLEFESQYEMDEFRLASRLQLLHQQYSEVYNNILSLFVDNTQQDGVGMPLLELEQMYSNIKVFIQDLRRNPVNQDSMMVTDNINRLARIFYKLADILNQADKEKIKTGERLFLRSPAYTFLLEPNEETKKWKITLDPRLISTGNALNSYGYTKKVSPADKPTREWREMHKEMVSRVRKIKVNTKRGNFNQ